MESIEKKNGNKVDVRIYYVEEDQKAADVFQRLGGYAVPHFFFVNAEGKIIKDSLGFPGEKQLVQMVDDLLAK